MANTFDPISKQQWLQIVEKDLKGRSLEELNWSLPEGLSVSPFAHSDDLPESPAPILRSTGQWAIGETIFAGADPAAANKNLLDILEKGVNSPYIMLGKAFTTEEISRLLQGVHLPYISIGIGGLQGALLHSFWGHFDDFLAKEYAQEEISWWLDASAEVGRKAFWQQVNQGGAKAPNLRMVDARTWFGGREHVVQELCQTTQQFVVILQEAVANEVDVQNLLKRMQLSVQIGSSYFLEIAKIRALKHLLANVLNSMEVEAASLPFLDAYLAPEAYSEETHSNKIRATSMAMSAVVGGVDRLTVLPSDGEEGDQSDAFNRRVARNVQHILMLESHLDHVVDPAAGSYYIEQLTQQLAAKAWKQV